MCFKVLNLVPVDRLGPHQWHSPFAAAAEIRIVASPTQIHNKKNIDTTPRDTGNPKQGNPILFKQNMENMKSSQVIEEGKGKN